MVYRLYTTNDIKVIQLMEEKIITIKINSSLQLKDNQIILIINVLYLLTKVTKTIICWPITLIIITVYKVGFSFKFHFHCYLQASFGSVVIFGSFF